MERTARNWGSSVGGRVRRAASAAAARWRDRTGEGALSSYYDAHQAQGADLRRQFLREPVQTLLAVVAVVRLPRRRAVLSVAPGGAYIAGVMRQRGPLGLPMQRTGAAVLDVPEEPSAYAASPGRQTLRRKVRLARRQGVVVRPVEADARPELLRRIVAAEQELRPASERSSTDLLDSGFWLAALDQEGEPLVVSVTPVDGEWAALRYFCSLQHGQATSDARYLLSQELVEHLFALGVRHLVDTWNPAHLPSGLRHFQRMLGYRLVRVHLSER